MVAKGIGAVDWSLLLRIKGNEENLAYQRLYKTGKNLDGAGYFQWPYLEIRVVDSKIGIAENKLVLELLLSLERFYIILMTQPNINIYF